VEDAAVLDGFAGTGAVGLEAISRGARTVTFVERDLATLRVLRRNIATCGAEDACAIIRASFFGLSTRHPEIGRFDLIFVDPPYDVDSLEAVVADGGRVLGPSGLLILEHSRRRVAPEPPGDLTHERTIAAGDSALTLYRAASSG
jgi:16S rRNA (guanine966-N2)-methyltransferase